MFPRVSLLAVLALSLLSVSAPVSATTLYTWHNADGSMTFTDDPTNAPPDAQVRVWAEVDSRPSPAPEPASPPAEAAAAPTAERYSRAVTQGEFAVQLVEELGLDDQPDADAAADLLTRVRIAPRLGQWELDQPLAPDLTLRLRKLTVAAAEEGWITLTPEQGLLAFDTAAALLGVTIPETADSDEASEESPLAIAAAPPLVYVVPPPPDVYPYYLWMPVAGGFWRNDVLVSGFFVLDANRFRDDRHRRHVVLTPDHIGHHFRGHLTDTHQVFDPPTRPHRDWRAPGSHASRGPSERRFVAPRPMTMSPTIRRQSAPSHRIDRMPPVRPPLHTRSVVRSISTPAVASQDPSPSNGRSLNTKQHRGDVGYGHGRRFSLQ